MNVETVTVDPKYAEEKLAEFRQLTVNQRRAEDVSFRRLWRAAKSGKPIIDLEQAFRTTGLNEQSLPRLGMARATWKECHFSGSDRSFYPVNTWRRQSRENTIRIPRSAWDWNLVRGKLSFTQVPFIPPNIRRVMDRKPANYFILFEVLDWKQYPADPFLLLPISDNMYIVVGEWDLTPLEVSLLKGIR